MQANPVLRDIVLLGGGHAHVVVIKQWGMNPLPGVKLTLISRDVLTPYSGMLPGLLSGHYTLAETHIDLSRLCRWANVRFICAEITGLDKNNKIVQLKARPPIAFDVLSIDTGSTPNLRSVDGASEFTVPVKPVHQFYQRWLGLLERQQHQTKPLNIGIVGAGAGGFELLMAMHYRLSKDFADRPVRLHWVIRNNQVLAGHNQKVRQLAIKECRKKNIEVHWNFHVEKVLPSQLISKNQALNLDEIMWCTDAVGPSWLKSVDLALDQRGFLSVNAFLQSIDCDSIFAAGDIATQIDNPRPKAGVFAVRAGPILAQNLRSYLLGRTLKPFRPQKKFLSILATGEKSAIASKGPFCASGRWVWRWKDYIDAGFMDKFNRLPPLKSMPRKALPAQLLATSTEDWSGNNPRCAGCGAKVGGDILSRVLGNIDRVERDDQIVGLDTPDDAAIFETGDRWLAQSVDQLRSMIDDPWLFAQIATHHALSDLYAVNAIPQSAMAMVSLPYASELIQERELEQLMRGIAKSLNQANCTLAGGHTNEASELSLGLVVNGLLTAGTIKRKNGLNAGDKLILTKPLGSGVLLAADMQVRCNGPDLQAGIKSMLESNQSAASIMSGYNVSALTDVTGFGLIGHLLEMLQSSNLICQLLLENIPMLPGALNYSDQGIRSTLYHKNAKKAVYIQHADRWQKHRKYPLLFDPQTSGGLLAGVSPHSVEDCVQTLKEQGYSQTSIIGEVMYVDPDMPSPISLIA